MQWEIEGDIYPLLRIDMDPGDSIKCDAGAMAWLSGDIRLQTKMQGGIVKSITRKMAGETFFRNVYTAYNPGSIAFATDYVGTIKPVEVREGMGIVIQKSALFVEDSNIIAKPFMTDVFTGLMGGEGFFLTELRGNGIAFLEAVGRCYCYELNPGQVMEISTGNFFAMERSCKMTVRVNKGVKNILFGGEGFVNTVVTGPGRVWVQSGSLERQVASIKNELGLPKK